MEVARSLKEAYIPGREDELASVLDKTRQLALISRHTSTTDQVLMKLAILAMVLGVKENRLFVRRNHHANPGEFQNKHN